MLAALLESSDSMRSTAAQVMAPKSGMAPPGLPEANLPDAGSKAPLDPFAKARARMVVADASIREGDRLFLQDAAPVIFAATSWCTWFDPKSSRPPQAVGAAR